MCLCCCDCCCCDCLLVFLAVIFPPLPVAIKRGLCSCDFIINVLLCFLGWLPGMIHAWYIILFNSRKVRIDDEERQIYIVTPPSTTHVIINKQPNQTKIKFKHPEPFLENSRNKNHYFNQNSSVLGSNNLSPLSHTPLTPSNLPNRVQQEYPSPLDGSANYGSIVDDEINLNSDGAPPPSYDIVMNETQKQFR